MTTAPVSAFVVKVPAAEPLAGDLRRRYDATVALGVPAHITVLVPFMNPALITPQVIERARLALGHARAFAFSLARVGRFPETAYLAPEPAEPFIAMTMALVAAFPEYLPYGGAHDGVVPHLSVAHGDVDDAEVVALELLQALDTAGPVHAMCGSVTLIENSSGRWQDMHHFALVGATPR